MIPSVLKRFPRNDYFARATLGEILGEDRIAAAQRFEATEFRSGVFLSQADGTFRFEPLPRLAQISPAQGMVACDLDGDGFADIYAGQNSYSPIPSVGRFDGGLGQMLRGDGKGGMVAVPLRDCGAVVPGDAKAVAAIDLEGDGWPDLLVTRNNGTTLAFRNRTVAGRNSLRVALRGPAGNPNGVGSRLSAVSGDGSTQTAEVRAGSGYFSQSAPGAFFGSTTANPLAHIDVRWPSGASSRHGVPRQSGTLVIQAPTT
jgi:hypothetical protein